MDPKKIFNLPPTFPNIFNNDKPPHKPDMNLLKKLANKNRPNHSIFEDLGINLNREMPPVFSKQFYKDLSNLK